MSSPDTNRMKGYFSTISASAIGCALAYYVYAMTGYFDTIDATEPLEAPSTTNANNLRNTDNAWSDAQVLFMKALIAALTSGLGGFPLYLLGKISQPFMGFSLIFAAGLMSGCSVVLFIEALEFESVHWVLCYVVLGVVVIDGISHLIGDVDEFEFAGLRGHSASKALLIVLSMGLHSLGEGVSVGVSATGERGETIGLLVIISLAIHNIPEGIAVSLLLMSQGMNVWTASIFAVISNIPQPLIAIPSFIFLESFKSLLPIGYGVASGAMTYIVCSELIPEAKDKISRSLLLSTFFISSGFIVSIAVCAQ